MGTRIVLHGGLFVLTVLSTAYVGGVVYSVAIVGILLAHEMGHYFMSNRYGVSPTLPYFIPFPLSPFGTFGAVIKMRGVITDKKALFDIGVAGPLCGFVLSLPCAFIGIKLSTVVKVGPSVYPLSLGEPLLLKLFVRLLMGRTPSGYDVLIHPLGFAGWVGLFITALNLLPIGQLDGGHIIYAVLGRKSRYVHKTLIVLLGILALFCNAGWLVLVALLLVFGLGHPDPLDPWLPLDRKRKILALVMLGVFVVSFVPAPFEGTGLIDLIVKRGR
jgi:membrane-associated protease RseP (regulator of RpoE activity)